MGNMDVYWLSTLTVALEPARFTPMCWYTKTLINIRQAQLFNVYKATCFDFYKCSVGKGEKRDFMGKVYMSSKVVRSEGLG